MRIAHEGFAVNPRYRNAQPGCRQSAVFLRGQTIYDMPAICPQRKQQSVAQRQTGGEVENEYGSQQNDGCGNADETAHEAIAADDFLRQGKVIQAGAQLIHTLSAVFRLQGHALGHRAALIGGNG